MKKFLFIMLLMLSISIALAQVTRYVHNGNSIQDTIDVSSDGDIINVYTGLYDSFDFDGKDLDISAIGTPVINGGNSNVIIDMTGISDAGATPYLGGFVITGNDTTAIGVYISGFTGVNAVIQSNIISSIGTAIYIDDNNDPVYALSNYIQYNNIGIRVEDSCDEDDYLHSNFIYFNDSGSYFGSGSQVQDMYDNYYENTISIENQSDSILKLSHCTTSDSYLGIYISEYSEVEIINSIIYGNDIEINNDSGTLSVTYSDIGGGIVGTGNINQDPVYIDADNHDYDLEWYSPCIDAGDPTEFDSDGTVCDMGYFTADPHETRTYNNSSWYWEGFPRLDVADGHNDGDFVDAIEMFEKIEHPDNPTDFETRWQSTTASLEGEWNSVTEVYDWTPSTCNNLVNSLRGFKTIMSGAASGSTELRIFGDLIDPSTELTVDISEDWTWLCYFLEDSQDFEDAFSEGALDSLYCVKTQTWIQFNYGGSWYGSGGTLNYLDLVLIQNNNATEDVTFTWQEAARGGVQPSTRPVPQHFTYTEEMDYYPVFMEFKDNIPDEVAVYINGTCKGAEVVDDPESFMLRAYLLNEPFGSELEFYFYTEENNICKADYEIKMINMERQAGKLTIGDLGDFATIEFLTPSDNIPQPDSQLRTYPNPFNPSITISYNIAEDSNVDLTVYNVKGQKVKTLINHQPYKEGVLMEKIWNGENDKGNPVSGGIYFIRLQTDYESQTNKVILLK